MIIKTNLANPRGIHTHCQVARKAKRTSQNLSKSMALPTLQEKANKILKEKIKE
jgi:hypothetical protein